jgi:hypothetical protein
MPKKSQILDDNPGFSSSDGRSLSGTSDNEDSSWGDLTGVEEGTKPASAPKAIGASTPVTSSNTDEVKTSKAKKASAPLTEKTTAITPPGNDEFTMVLPSSWMTTGNPPPGECNLLIQLDPEDAKRLDYEGVSGAIGRFEAGDSGILLDLKGHQYQGSILPGPTAMIVSLIKGQQLRVEGVTDEFVPMVQTSDVMAKFDAVVTGAQLDDGYRYVEENVNRVDRSKQQQMEQPSTVEKGTKKRAGASKPKARRRKKSAT